MGLGQRRCPCPRSFVWPIMMHDVLDATLSESLGAPSCVCGHARLSSPAACVHVRAPSAQGRAVLCRPRHCGAATKHVHAWQPQHRATCLEPHTSLVTLARGHAPSRARCDEGPAPAAAPWDDRGGAASCVAGFLGGRPRLRLPASCLARTCVCEMGGGRHASSCPCGPNLPRHHESGSMHRSSADMPCEARRSSRHRRPLTSIALRVGGRDSRQAGPLPCCPGGLRNGSSLHAGVCAKVCQEACCFLAHVWATAPGVGSSSRPILNFPLVLTCFERPAGMQACWGDFGPYLGRLHPLQPAPVPSADGSPLPAMHGPTPSCMQGRPKAATDGVSRRDTGWWWEGRRITRNLPSYQRGQALCLRATTLPLPCWLIPLPFS